MQLEQIIVIDTETGGLDPQEHSILSLAMVSWCGQFQKEFFIAEDVFHTNPSSMEVNQINLEWLRTNGMSPQQACEEIDLFLDYFSQKPLVLAGHNISFDIAFLRRLYRLAGRPFSPSFSHRSIDTHTLLWALVQKGEFGSEVCSSDGAFNHFNVAPTPELRHTALGDAIATQALLKKILGCF